MSIAVACDAADVKLASASSQDIANTCQKFVIVLILDEFLLRQPNNPYLLTIVSVISGQIVGLARGDQAVFMIEMVGGIISCLVIFRLWRLVTGRTISYQAVPVATG